MKRIFVKPARVGLIIRDPKNKQSIPDSGKYVVESTYWRRRIHDGDLLVTSEPKVQSKQKEKISTENQTKSKTKKQGE